MKGRSPSTRFVPVFAILAICVLGCQYFQLPEHLQSEAARENPRTTLDDAIVFLNSQDSGRISDIGRPRLGETSIDQRLAEVMKQREDNGVLLENTNLVANNVYLFADPELSIEAFANLYLATDASAGIVYIPKDSTPDPPVEPQKPNPLTLIVSTGGPVRGAMPFFDWPIYDPDFKLSYDIELEIAKSADQLKSTRMWEDSFEISADERYFINEKQGSDADYGPKHSRVKQRRIEETQVKDELIKLPVSSDRKLIIVSEKASYGALMSILEHAKDRALKFRVVVRPNAFNDHSGVLDR